MNVDAHSSSVTATGTDSASPEPGLLQLHLVNWPLRDQPWRSVIMALLLVATSIFAGQAASSTSMGILVGVAVLTASWRYWLPVTYEIGPYGIRQIVLGRVQRLSWRQIGRLEIRERGIRFLPDHDPAQLANVRGLYIYNQGQEEALKQVVNYYIASMDATGSSSRPTVH